MRAAVSRLSLIIAAGGIAALGAATPVAAQTPANSAPAVSPPSCAAAYRTALDGIRNKRGDALSALVRSIRAGDPQMTGRWLFSAAMFDPSRKPKTERVCTETVVGRNGKSRCASYETQTIPRTDEPAFTSASSADEVKDLKALAQFVEGKGAVPELGTNGRYGFLFQRVAQDLRSYLTQEPHPALCAGGGELAEFYEAQVVPLKRRQSESGDLAKRTRAMAISRFVAIEKTEADAREKFAAAAAVTTTSGAPAMAAPSNTAVPSTGGAAAATPPALDLTNKSLIELAADAVLPVATPEQRAAIAAAATPLQALLAARNAVIASQTATAPAANPSVRNAVNHALRMIEAAAYADLQRSRYAEIASAMFSTTSEVGQAHKATCTCPN